MAQTHIARRARPQRQPVLEQGIAIAGELRVKLFGLSILPVQVKLLVSSKDVAAQLGLDWWSDEKARASIKRPDRPHRNGRRAARG